MAYGTIARPGSVRDVDLCVRRADLPAIRAALEARGFIYRPNNGIDTFLDRAGTKLGEGVHLLFAGERVRETDATPVPDVTESEDTAKFRVLTLEGLVRTKLVAYRLKDRVHLLDLIGVGAIDATWPARYPATLAERLQALLDDPNG